MPQALWAGSESRKITTRIVVEGDLVLHTPAHLGNGDSDELTDMPLLVDPYDGKTPLLTGASIAGAMRSYLRARQYGHRRSLPSRNDQAAVQQERAHSVAVKVFGGFKGDDEGEQSPLIVDDAFGKYLGIERREGVHITPASRTAADDKFFTMHLWQAGTTFRLRFELLLREGEDAETLVLKQAFSTALQGFVDGGITLGARKRRGYGRVHVDAWRLKIYDLRKTPDLLTWLADGDQPLGNDTLVADLKAALGVTSLLTDQRHIFHLEATFVLEGSLLIRSGGDRQAVGPDMVHIHAHQADGQRRAIVPGTSLGGALRARAMKIANTLGATRANALIEALFGRTDKASRMSVRETIVKQPVTPLPLVQNRVSIDRFTGGARDTALFSEQPVFGGADTLITVDTQLIQPHDYEIGLLLLLLKDLWTGDLPLGGASSIGRGRLQGQQATLTWRRGSTAHIWHIMAHGQSLAVTGDDRDLLEDCVRQLNVYLQEAVA